MTPKLLVEFRSLSSAEEFLLVLQKHDATEDGETAALTEFIINKGGIKKSRNIIVYNSGKFDFKGFKMSAAGERVTSSFGINDESNERSNIPSLESYPDDRASKLTISRGSQSGSTASNDDSRHLHNCDEGT